MELYKSPVAGTNKVRLGASTCISALPSELVGILMENAALLGPDYIVDRQEVGCRSLRGAYHHPVDRVSKALNSTALHSKNKKNVVKSREERRWKDRRP